MRDLVGDLAATGASSDDLAGAIDADGIAANLYTADLPDPDVVIRTSGEARLSGFLLWQSAYAEYVFTPVLWPDFDTEELTRCIAEYQARERRYGGADDPFEADE